MPDSRREALQRQIEAAFADAPHPGDDRIGYDADDWESAELARAFKGRQWKELSPVELQYHSSSFLSSEGFRYYLPAYLLAALEDHGNLMPHTVYGLTLPQGSSPEEQRLRAWQLERFEVLSPTQKRAVRAFLEFARDEASHYFSQGQEPRLALERYWEQQ
ncbi:DUF6714 family protein [Archangium violaceum]|uniref:Uncharacterized protein n=1 Tax=Archangium violaceum Cb vi76 TaxID=1406225 RepID=A0A084SR26_9BACT|nr:DUF6714 family protein [Archangium violaceum]KFA90911.1 hypothetical protein Q664_25445 [Archangium violaceum Cb vi76]